MNKLSLKKKDILSGIEANRSNIYSLIPNIIEELSLCFDKDSNLSFVDLDNLFKKYLIEMEILIASSCSFTRYLGFVILLHRGDTTELLWSAFEDPFIHIRMLIIRNFYNSNRHKLFNEIFKHFTKDPRIVVRREAQARIRENFSDLFSLKIENLSSQDQRNILPLLNVENSHDRKILEDFSRSDSRELSSMAVYYLQREKPERALPHFSRASDFSLLRYLSLQKYAQKNHSQFPEAFCFVSPSAPLDLQDEFLHELSRSYPNSEEKESYRYAMNLIKFRSDPYCSKRLEEYFNNKSLFQLLGTDLIEGFSTTNQYQTFPLLLSLIKKEEEGSMKNKLMQKAASFNLPLTREFNLESI